MEKALETALKAFAGSDGYISILTGAGISAESGIPTFRGPEGYWTIGSKEYHPQEMATRHMFGQRPYEVWKWYLYRLEVCRAAAPNPGHMAVVEMEKHFGRRFTLITQNVDGLHLRAGNSAERTFHIHGNVFYMRCAEECSREIFPVPEALYGWEKSREITGPEKLLLRCPKCGGMTRPHVLWFDEAYDETFYRFHSTLNAAARTDLLLIAGTSGATNLPNQVAWQVSQRPQAIMVDINIEPNPFSNLALRSGGFAVQEASGTALPAILDIFRSV